MLERAATVRADIERDAQTKRDAIAAIFAGAETPKGRTTKRETGRGS